VINKADREGVDRVVAELHSMLSLAAEDARPEIVETVAANDVGTDEVLSAVERYLARAGQSGALAARKTAQLRRLFEQTLQARLMERVRARALPEAEMERTLERLNRRELDPFAASDEVLGRLGL